MATAQELGFGIGDFIRRNKGAAKKAAINAVIPTTALIDPAAKTAQAATDVASGVRMGVTGQPIAKPVQSNVQPTQAATIATAPAAQPAIMGNGLDNLPTVNYGVMKDQGQAQAPAVVATSAETVAMNPVAAGVRKIVGKDGSATYTNDKDQPGGSAVGDGRGTLSVIGDPRTAGMSPAQAAEYWRSVSSGIDAKNATREQERILSDSIIQPGDSIGVIQAKALNRRGATQQMNIGVQQQSISDQARSRMIQDPEEQKRRGLETQGLELGVQGKIRELAAQKQIDDLRNRYMNATDPDEKRSLGVQLNALQGKAQDKFQVVTEQGVSDMGTPTKTSFLVDAEGNVRPVSQGANTQIAPAPEAAVAYLMKNPSQKAAFQAKYGYLPEGV